jgi:hypothetical protein
MFRHAADEDHDARARRAMRLLPVYAGMLTAVQSKGAIANLSKFQLYVAMLILLDKGGISDDAIAELRKMRVCAGPDTARRAILKSSLSLDAHFVMARRCHASRPPRPSATRPSSIPSSIQAALTRVVPRARLGRSYAAAPGLACAVCKVCFAFNIAMRSYAGHGVAT